jgi:hypothetical protein
MGYHRRYGECSLGGLAQGDGHIQRPDRQVALHAVADGPANDPARIQIQNDSQVQPALAGLCIRDVARQFSVRCRCGKVPVQQIWSHRQGVIAVGGRLVFPGSDGDDAVFSHQTLNTTLSRLEFQLAQLFRH